MIIYCWSQVRSVVNFRPSKFWTLLQGVSKVVMHTGLNVYKESSEDSRFITNSVLASYKWPQTRFTSCANLIFLVTFIKLGPLRIQKKHILLMDWNKRKPQIQTLILEIFQKQPFDFIAITPRGILGLCCVYISQLMTHAVIYTCPFTLQLCYKPLGIRLREKLRVKKFKYQVTMHCENFITLTLLDIGPKIFSGRG